MGECENRTSVPSRSDFAHALARPDKPANRTCVHHGLMVMRERIAEARKMLDALMLGSLGAEQSFAGSPRRRAAREVNLNNPQRVRKPVRFLFP